MAGNNDPYVQFGVPGQSAIDKAKADAIAAAAPASALYTQDALMSVAMNAVLAAQEVSFSSVPQRGGSGVGEIVLVGGRITIPAAVVGRWSVVPGIDVSLGTTVTLEGRLLDAAGVAIPNSRYPRKSPVPALSAGSYNLASMPIIYKTDTSQAYTLQIWASGLLAVNVTAVSVALTKLGDK